MATSSFNAVAGAVNEKDSYDILWTGDAHTVGDIMNLSHSVKDYKRILFVFNVIPSRTPQFDVNGDCYWYPEFNTFSRWDVGCAGVSIPAITIGHSGEASTSSSGAELKVLSYSKASSQTYTPGIVKVIGFKTY